MLLSDGGGKRDREENKNFPPIAFGGGAEFRYNTPNVGFQALISRLRTTR
jgi:hypothetical protein